MARAVVAGMVAWPLLVAAQADPADEAGDDDVRVLEEVVVTAQKVEKTLKEVPASVSTLEGKFIQETGAFGFGDLQTYASNVEIRITPIGGSLRMRGFGTQSSNAGFEPSVGTVVDGVAYGRSNFLVAFFHDLDRVEILRGPQGTLFGKNSTAGVMNVLTENPDTVSEQYRGKLEVLYGDLGERNFRPAFDIPLGDGLAARLSGSYSKNDGQLHNTLLNRAESDVEQRTTRLKVAYDLSGPVTWELGAFHSRQDLNNGIYQLAIATDDLLTLARDYDPQVEADPLNFLVSANVPTIGATNFTGSNFNLDIELPPNVFGDSVTLTSISAFAELTTKRRDIDADFSPIPFIRTSLIEPLPFRQFSQELRISASNPTLFGWGHGFEFVTGVYYYDSALFAADRFELEDLGAAAAFFAQMTANDNGFGGTLLPGVGGTTADVISALVPAVDLIGQGEQMVLTRLDQTGRTMAAFGQFEHFFYPEWAVIAGLRIGREEKTGVFDTDVIGDFVGVIANAETFDRTIERSEDEFSPKLGLKWEPVDDLNVYGTWSRGFKSGGFNAIALTPESLDFEPERAESYEIGAKARLLGGAMRVNAAAFRTDFSNLQVSSFEDASFFILNAAEARSQGFELDLTYLPPIPGTKLFASMGFTDARFTSYPNAPAFADSDDTNQDLSGGRLPVSSRWSATLVPSFTALIPGVQWGVNTAIDVLYRGDRFLDVDLDPRTLQEATTEVNARITVGDLLETWRVTIAGRNLTDERILDRVLDQPLSPGNFSAIRGDRGRFVSANVTLNF